MIRSCTVIDSFLPFPERFRELALRQEFGPVEYDDHTYEGIATDFKLEDVPGVTDRLERALGSPLDLQMSFWRIGLEGDVPTSWIHADSICADMAALLYLSEPRGESGTAFWRHRGLDWHELPRGEEALRVAGYDGELHELADRLFADSHDAGAWEKTDVIHGRFNRLAVYPSNRFHSRYPRDAWGDSPETGRLLWVGFFNVKEH